MRGPIPGMARISASVAVLMLIGTIAPVVLAVVPVAAGGGVVVVVVDDAMPVSPVTLAVSVWFSVLAVHAATAMSVEQISALRAWVKPIMRVSMVIWRNAPMGKGF